MFPLLLLVVYSVGYLYLKFYYSGLGIFFEYYISLSDILFFSLNRLIIFGIIYIIFRTVIKLMFFIYANSIIRKMNVDVRNIKLSRRAFFIYKRKIYNEFRRYLIALLVLSSSFYIIYGAIMEGSKEYSIMLRIFIVVFVLVGQYWIFLEKNEDGKKFDFVLLKLGVVVMVISISSIFLGILDSNLIDKRSDNLSLKFDYNGNVYSTIGQEHFYIGETSEYIFLYEKINKKSLAFRKADLKNLQFFSNKK